ncbi:hypothetical protein BH09VER1_BH09VER1_41450 [soil metagenome]
MHSRGSFLAIFQRHMFMAVFDPAAAASLGIAVARLDYLLIAMIVMAIGHLITYWANVPSGPAIAMVLSFWFIAAYLFGPKYGVIPKLLRPRQ